MFLKSLSMKGFKSFADPTVLEFEPGITVVVGPNGSGKSNVVDAVTWVLGAQGPRSLRSAKMEDVIFAGTSSRPALGRAEVSLTIDNASGKLPIDLAEVTITRTLFRSGDSEYAINGAPCRLLDIQELLSDSGVGRQQHMIIGQGQLDTVLNARPEDRRAIIEEAAGVLKHRRRRERAERRLAGTAENLERLGDLVREVRRQIRPLERQAAAARSHATVATELMAIRRFLAGTELAELTERHRTAASDMRICRDEERELHAALELLEAEATSASAELSSRREEDLASALAGCRDWSSGPGALRACSASAAGPSSVALDASADVDVVSTLEAEAARLAGEIARRPTEATAARTRAQAGWWRPIWPLEAEEAELRRALGRRGRRRHAPRRPPALAPGPHRGRPAAAARERQDLDDLDERVAVLEQRHAGAAVKARPADQRSRRPGGDRRPPGGASVAAQTAGLEDADRAGQPARAGGRRGANKCATAPRPGPTRSSGPCSDLQGAGGRELLRGVDGVVGSLMDLVEMDAGWEAAFEAAGGRRHGRRRGGRAHARPIRPWRRCAKRGVTGAVLAPRERRPGPWTWSPCSRRAAGPSGCAATSGPAHGDATAESVLDALVGHAVRVDGWEEAIDLSLERTTWSWSPPRGTASPPRAGGCARGAAWSRRPSVEEARQRRADAAAAAADAARAELTAARADLARARDGPGRGGAGGSTATPSSARVDGGRHRAHRSRSSRHLGEELGGGPRRRAPRPQQRLAEARGRAATPRAPSLPQLEEAAAAWQSLAQRRTETAGAPPGARGAPGRPGRAPPGPGRPGGRGRAPPGRARRGAGHRGRRGASASRPKGPPWPASKPSSRRERARLDEILDALRGDYKEQVDAVRAGGERLEQLRQDRHTTDQRLEAVRTRTRALDLETNEVVAAPRGAARAHRPRPRRDPRGGRRPAHPRACPRTPTHQHYAAELERKLAALGPVNPLALEELSTLEERHKELEVQVDDVRGARRELHEVVRTLDEEIMTSFAAAAADVNEHFSTLVALLFPGGTGRLVLIEPDDLLNTGVEIEVRPAGRNVRRVSLLSGGERSMAALAFLFAVFRSRPSPFYLMDEVEAALDDVNLNRFLGLVRQFRHEAQLLIVTHQKRTMETGDALYGVTMAPGRLVPGGEPEGRARDPRPKPA